jgi:xylono-1,5-lactonase
VECVWPVGALLGEGPVWSAVERTLWFVDIKGRKLHCLAEAGGATRTFDTPEYAAFVFPDRRGGLLCGLRSGLFHFDPQSGEFELLLKVDAEHPGNRLNDGHVDSQGRLWFGTMDDSERETTGSLYRYGSGRLECLDSGYVISNGPALSPDGKTLYHVDTVQGCVYAFDVDPRGALSGKRVFVKIDAADGHPDGTAVDRAGNLWVALFGGWGVRCYSPRAELLSTIDVPVAQCTKAAFGGPDLRTLYVTTAAIGLTDAQRAQQPLAGGLFRTRVEIPGLPPAAFAG